MDKYQGWLTIDNVRSNIENVEKKKKKRCDYTVDCFSGRILSVDGKIKILFQNCTAFSIFFMLTFLSFA